MVVVQGKYWVLNYFPPEMDPDTCIVTLENGFITSQITAEWLKHIIGYLDVGP